jgi:hypothetical protein
MRPLARAVMAYPNFPFFLFTLECRSAMRIAEILVVKDEKMVYMHFPAK